MPCPSAGQRRPACWCRASTGRAHSGDRPARPPTSDIHRSSKSSATSAAESDATSIGVCCPLERCRQPPYPIEKFFRTHLLTRPIDQQPEREGCRALDLTDGDKAGHDPLQSASETASLELPLQHLAVRLKQQQVLRVIAGEHVVQQSAGGLNLLDALVRSRIPLKDKPGHPGDLAELPACQLSGIQARRNVMQQV